MSMIGSGDVFDDMAAGCLQTYGVRCELDAGKYYLLAFTSGCSLPVSKASTDPQRKLVKKKAGSSDGHTLTKEFKYVSSY